MHALFATPLVVSKVGAFSLPFVALYQCVLLVMYTHKCMYSTQIGFNKINEKPIATIL